MHLLHCAVARRGRIEHSTGKIITLLCRVNITPSIMRVRAYAKISFTIRKLEKICGTSIDFQLKHFT